MADLTTFELIVSWGCRLITAGILLQTLYFKFTAAPESVFIFTRMRMESWGRIGTGIAELVATVLLFIPGLVWLGAGLAFGLMSGAVISHLTVLGVEVENDRGLLFALAVIVLVCCGIVLFLFRQDILALVDI